MLVNYKEGLFGNRDEIGVKILAQDPQRSPPVARWRFGHNSGFEGSRFCPRHQQRLLPSDTGSRQGGARNLAARS